MKVARQAALKAGDDQSSKEKGDVFEKEVADVFRCIPNAKVETHVKVGGKDVDILVLLKEPFGLDTRIVIDAKDYKKPITRERTAQEHASYYPLVANGQADQFMLTTRNGIVANAKEVFDGKKALHLTISDLQNRIADPTQLLQDMIHTFAHEGLSNYYIKTQFYTVDLDYAQTNYDRCYNDFITHCLSSGFPDLSQAAQTWLSKTSGRGKRLVELYDDADFKSVMLFRRGQRTCSDLEELVCRWVNKSDYNVSIALLGTYGTGKSSFSKRIACRIAEDFQAGKCQRIPLLIELRNFGSH